MGSGMVTGRGKAESHDELPEQIRNAVVKAHECATVDPAVCLMCCVAAAELILRDLCVRHRMPIEVDEVDADGVRARRLTAAELIKSLRSKRRMPKNMQSAFHEVRKAGNAAKHDWRGDAKTARKVLRRLEEICAWYAPAPSQSDDLSNPVPYPNRYNCYPPMPAQSEGRQAPRAKVEPVPESVARARGSLGRCVGKLSGETSPSGDVVKATPPGAEVRQNEGAPPQAGAAQERVVNAAFSTSFKNLHVAINAPEQTVYPASTTAERASGATESVAKPESATLRINFGLAAIGYAIPPALALPIVSVAVTPEAPAVVLGGLLSAAILGVAGGLLTEGYSEWAKLIGALCLISAACCLLATLYSLGSAVLQVLTANWPLCVAVIVAWTMTYGVACFAYAKHQPDGGQHECR